MPQEPAVLIELLKQTSQSLKSQGKCHLCEPLLQEALRCQRNDLRLADHDPALINTKKHLAKHLERLQRYDEAEILLQEVVTAEQTNKQSTHLDTLQSMQDLAESWERRHDDVRAREIRQRQVDLSEAALGSDSRRHQYYQECLADCLERTNYHDQALELQQRIFNQRCELAAQLQLDITVNMASLANLYCSAGLTDEAMELGRQAVQNTTNDLAKMVCCGSMAGILSYVGHQQQADIYSAQVRTLCTSKGVQTVYEAAEPLREQSFTGDLT